MENNATTNIPVPCNYILQGPAVIQINEEDIPYTFFTSDLHIGHKNILNFTQRGQHWKDTDEMEVGLICNIQNTLYSSGASNEHTVRLFHCGDLIFGSKSQSTKILARLQTDIDLYANTVYAVFGNHDIDNILKYHRMIPTYSFNSLDASCDPHWFWNNVYVVEVMRGTKCILRFTVSHFPMEEYYGSFNIHGHLHSEPVVADTANNKEIILRYRNTGHHFDCGVDNNNYRPVSLKDILENKTSIVINKTYNYGK